MFRFDNWTIQADGDILARQFDNLTRTLTVTGDIPVGWEWVVLVQVDSAMDIIPLTATDGALSAVLTAQQLSIAGYYQMQLRATQGELVRHTNTISVYIPESLSGNKRWPTIPSEFTALENRVEEDANRAEAARENAEGAAKRAEEAAGGKAGGYYAPNVTQPAAGTMQVSFAPSEGNMPAVPDVSVTLPTGPAGADGYTPVKGVDYYTETDKQELVDVVATSVNAVLFTPQELTEEQKAQARANIGAKAEEETIGVKTTEVSGRVELTDCVDGEITINEWELSAGDTEMRVTARRTKNVLDPAFLFSGTNNEQFVSLRDNGICTINGLTVTRDGGVFTVNGTATARTIIESVNMGKPYKIPAGTYAFTSCPPLGSSSSYYVQWKNSTTDANLYMDYGLSSAGTYATSPVVTLAEDTFARCNIVIVQGCVCNNLQFKLQIVDTPISAEDYTNYTPFDGVSVTLDASSTPPVTGLMAYDGYTAVDCPSAGSVSISYHAADGTSNGDNTLTIDTLIEQQPNLFHSGYQTGNLLDNSNLLYGYRIGSNGNISELASAVCCEEYIDITKAQGTHLAMYLTVTDTQSASRCYYRSAFYDKNKNVISVCDAGGSADMSNAIVEIPDNAVYVRVSYLAQNEAYTYLVVRGSADMDLGMYDYTPIKTVVVPADLIEQLAKIDELSVMKHQDDAEFTISMLNGSNTFSQNDITFVGDELWVSKESATYYTNGTMIFRYKVVGGEFTLVGTCDCDFGHLNTMDYCAANDCLIFGNGGNDTETTGNYFVVVKNPLSLGSTALLADVGIKYDVDIGFKVQALWGGSNLGDNNVVYLLSNNSANITKVLLLKEDSGEFNGSFVTLESRELEAWGVQGADIFGDTLYIGGQLNGNEYAAVKEISLSDYSTKIVSRKFYAADGTAVTGCVQGVYVNKDAVWLCINSGDTTKPVCLTKYYR